MRLSAYHRRIAAGLRGHGSPDTPRPVHSLHSAWPHASLPGLLNGRAIFICGSGC